ncbi:MAG: ABC transporter permease [Deferribacterales bacterium]
MNPFKQIYLYRKLIWATTLYDIKVKNAGSMLGQIWLILYPLLFLGMYAVVYLMIFKIRLQIMSPYEYVLLIFCGLIPFLSFADAIGRGVTSVTSNANLIKNTLFPIEFIPINIVLSSQVILIVGFSILSVILFFMGRLGWFYWVGILLFFEQIIFTIGLVWILASLNVFFRDLGQIISVVILMLMMISPIAYTEDMIPETLRTVLYFNPLYYLIMLYQKAFMFNTLDVKLFIVFTILSFGHFLIGYHVFVKLKGVFSDYV